MKTLVELRKEQKAIEAELAKRQTEAIDELIQKLFNYGIAKADRNYEFIKEIEMKLREFKRDYCEQKGPKGLIFFVVYVNVYAGTRARD